MDLVRKVAVRFIQSGITVMPVGATEEFGDVRVQRFNGSFRVWDLTNAGKRGKKVSVLAVVAGHPGTGDFNILRMIDGYTKFDQIVSTVKDYLTDFPEDAKMYLSEERGVDVLPGGFKELTIRGDHVGVTVSLLDFIVKDLDDDNNESTCIPAISGGKRDIPAFYSWVKENETKVKQMSFHDILNVMKALGLKYHSYCARD